MDGLSVAQAATVLGVTQAAVYKRIQRGTVEHDKDAEGRVFHSRRVSLSQRPCYRRSGKLLLRLPCRRRLTLQDRPTNRRDSRHPQSRKRGMGKARGRWASLVGISRGGSGLQGRKASGKEVNHLVWVKRTKDLFAAFMVGNGVLDLIAPRERYSMWSLARASAG